MRHAIDLHRVGLLLGHRLIDDLPTAKLNTLCDNVVVLSENDCKCKISRVVHSEAVD